MSNPFAEQPVPGDAIPTGDDHYPADVVGDQIGLAGGGLHAHLTGSHLHPPMIDDAAMWSDGRLWGRGAEQHAIEVGEFAGLRAGERVLDIGSGLGGPARQWAMTFGVEVVGISNSDAHVRTARQLNEARPEWRKRITVVKHDCQEAPPLGPFDAAISLNMIYQVPDHRAMFNAVRSALTAGGRLVVDDWMLTPLATDEERQQLQERFGYANFARTDTLETDLLSAGYLPIERVIDLGHVARGPMAEHCEEQLLRYFKPIMMAAWPGSPESMPGRVAYGAMMVDEFAEAVNLTLSLYRDRKMTYRRVIARRPS